MERPESYKTRQGRQILEYMSSLGGSHVTVDQIMRHFKDEGALVGMSTIYRHLEKLVADRKIRKYEMAGGASACYQYISNAEECVGHFHLLCEGCGELIHLDCELLDEIGGHLLASHDFQLDILKTVFYGKCEKCRKGA
jgi:Fur family ferric uptake transcriptional regulator